MPYAPPGHAGARENSLNSPGGSEKVPRQASRKGTGMKITRENGPAANLVNGLKVSTRRVAPWQLA